MKCKLIAVFERFGAVILATCAFILLGSTAAIAAWTFTTPANGQNIGKFANLSPNGAADAADVSFSFEVYYKSSATTIIQSSSGTSTSTMTWGTSVTPPNPAVGWSTAAADNPAPIKVVPASGTGASRNVNFVN